MECIGKYQEAGADKQAHIDTIAKLTNNRRQNNRQKTYRCSSQTSPSSGIVEIWLQHQRQQGQCTHIHHKAQGCRNNAYRKVSISKQWQIDNRVFLAQLPNNKIGQEHQSGNAQNDNLSRGKPVQFLAPIQHHL